MLSDNYKGSGFTRLCLLLLCAVGVTAQACVIEPGTDAVKSFFRLEATNQETVDFTVISEVAKVTPADTCSLTYELVYTTSGPIPRLSLTGDGQLVYTLTTEAEVLPTFEIRITANDGTTYTITEVDVVVVKSCYSEVLDGFEKDRVFEIPESATKSELVYDAS